MTTEERIAKDAETYSKENVFYSPEEVTAFEVGAKSERNKTIDEAIQMICSTAPEYGPIEISVRRVYELLNSLKI